MWLYNSGTKCENAKMETLIINQPFKPEEKTRIKKKI